jgi:hypothetical protein
MRKRCDDTSIDMGDALVGIGMDDTTLDGIDVAIERGERETDGTLSGH